MWITLVVSLGAVARLTRLAAADIITQPLRNRLLYTAPQRAALRDPTTPLPAPVRPRAAQARAWAHGLISCPWCVSIWLAALVAVLAWLYGDTLPFLLVTSGLTLSYATGWLAGHE